MKNPSRVPAMEVDWISAPAKKADAIKKDGDFLCKANLFENDRFSMGLVGSDWWRWFLVWACLCRLFHGFRLKSVILRVA
jgi:hypothetical protein